MKLGVNVLIAAASLSLLACATQEVKQDLDTVLSSDDIVALSNNAAKASGQQPPRTVTKNGKTLDLVRIMDGGACKNDYQGAKGEFLVYAYGRDIERIKAKKGPQIFAEFEVRIQDFSTQALEQAIDETNLAEDPFTLGTDEAQRKLAKQLSASFHSHVSAALNKFIAETTFTIDVLPFVPSLIFYQHGCEATEVEPEN
ncbi:MAG: hypothetical protein ABL925_05585 [Methylococcales bacterium]